MYFELPRAMIEEKTVYSKILGKNAFSSKKIVLREDVAKWLEENKVPYELKINFDNTSKNLIYFYDDKQAMRFRMIWG